MTHELDRRTVLTGLAAGMLGTSLVSGMAFAQSGTTLESLRAAGVVRIGMANQPPYSGLAPDGTITGFVPTLVQEIMARLGVPKVEPYIATYGELIPGLQAGRWQMIAASFRLTADRCGQVLFTDPVTFDGGALAYVPAEVPQVPADLTALAASDLTIGVLQGSYLVGLLEGLGIASARISQFPDNPALIDGIQTRRVRLAVSTNAALLQLRQQRNGAFEVAYPLPEDPPVGSAPAFSPADAELHAAFQTELRAMRAAGDVDAIGARFGFGPPPEAMVGVSAEEACRRVGG
jgi:polar amino acid transport system substrate-binding protein